MGTGLMLLASSSGSIMIAICPPVLKDLRPQLTDKQGVLKQGLCLLHFRRLLSTCFRLSPATPKATPKAGSRLLQQHTNCSDSLRGAGAHACEPYAPPPLRAGIASAAAVPRLMSPGGARVAACWHSLLMRSYLQYGPFGRITTANNQYNQHCCN